jgi:hypothetical protein
LILFIIVTTGNPKEPTTPQRNPFSYARKAWRNGKI